MSDYFIHESSYVDQDVEIGSGTQIWHFCHILSHSIIGQNCNFGQNCVVGPNATIVCGITIGQYAFIGAGAVVTKDVPDFALMLGNPARQKGWVSAYGNRLQFDDDGTAYDQEEQAKYRLLAAQVYRLSG